MEIVGHRSRERTYRKKGKGKTVGKQRWSTVHAEERFEFAVISKKR